MAAMIASEQFDVALASRILGRGALVGGMPLYKYISNRFLTLFENIMISQKLSEYHTGYRAWSRTVLKKLPLQNNSEDFVFDNQMLAQSAYFGSALARSASGQSTSQTPLRLVSSAVSSTALAF
jgi:hypothetical protein